MNEEENRLLNAVIGMKVMSVDGMEKGSEEVDIRLAGGGFGNLCIYHEPDCCETVELYDFDLTGSLSGRILSAEVVSGDTPESPDEFSDSHTWSFVKIKTECGDVTMRWLGESNGYYSEVPQFRLSLRA